MKRLKAIFNAIRTLGRNPHVDITAAWERIQRDLMPSNSASSDADRHLIAQAIFGVADEAEAWLKKQGEQTDDKPAA